MGYDKNEIENKILNGIELIDEEIRYAVDNLDFIDEVEGDANRWDRGVSTIIEIDDKLFKINWRRGLTESQESSYYNQPYQVEKRVEIKQITTVSYERVDEA